MADGLVVVDKPPGMTSHDVVGRCRRIFAQRRVGHAGTLDPDATGVLLVGLGRATRLMQFLTGLTKSYTGEIVLGTATSTLDASGRVIGTWDMSAVTVEAARTAASRFVGDIEQIPPMVSAIKIDGRRLHELARAGIEVDRPPRAVTVARFDLQDLELQGLGLPDPDLRDPDLRGAAARYSGGPVPVLRFAVDCSSGTYVRSLAADLGAALGGGAHLRRLRRTAVGRWTTADAVALDEVGPDAVLPPAAVVAGLPTLVADQEVADAVSHGKVLDAADVSAAGTGPWAVVDGTGDLLAVYEQHGPGRVKPRLVLAASDRSAPGDR